MFLLLDIALPTHQTHHLPTDTPAHPRYPSATPSQLPLPLLRMAEHGPVLLQNAPTPCPQR
jgi:hypothetical protein